MTSDDRQAWPYLSPTRFGWELVDGVTRQVRELVVSREIPSGETVAGRPSTLDALGRMSRLRRLIEDDTLGLVAEAYFLGTSWADIARQLGRSKQSVHQRYSRLVHAAATHERLAAQMRQAAERARRYRPGTRAGQ